ncbi:hypothetical protein CYMTET_22310 [Cymbomonas tetramitiformis]|uniref:Uncharacterized protein n=1 Tax=Cymbomonas tetramitiformis TaxID=36881 RepID=A0AAE0G070_9CHLO|nr:hypothetical protein CYMTET_22310 [Cymbomonas tetramitiformis]
MVHRTGKKGAQGRKDRDKQYELAIEFCTEKYCSAQVGINTGMFPLVKVQGLQRRMRGAVWNGVNTKSLLTPVEEEEVVTWLESCTDGHKARNRRETGSKICEVLTNRDRRNKASKGRKYKKLSRAVIQCLANGGPNPSWFQAFFEKHKHRVNQNV